MRSAWSFSVPCHRSSSCCKEGYRVPRMGAPQSFLNALTVKLSWFTKSWIIRSRSVRLTLTKSTRSSWTCIRKVRRTSRASKSTWPTSSTSRRMKEQGRASTCHPRRRPMMLTCNGCSRRIETILTYCKVRRRLRQFTSLRAWRVIRRWRVRWTRPLRWRSHRRSIVARLP